MVDYPNLPAVAIGLKHAESGGSEPVHEHACVV